MSAAVPTPLPAGPASAKEAGLYYASDADPGISRIKVGRGFAYRTADGRAVRDRATLERIRSLVIPPAWTRVWIAPRANAHLQATGRDARGRKQYRYHPRWTAVRDDTKYTRMLAFAKVLPAIRRRVAADLRRAPLSRERVLATVVALLERTLIRVGNDEYARTNGSFGLTTLLDRHVDVRGRRVRFHFRAKSGVMQKIDLHDALLARSVQRCQDLPGQTLFQYVDDAGVRRTISSTDVNEYLRDAAGEEFTAQDFRTWGASTIAFEEMIRRYKKHGQVKLKSVLEPVAEALGNTAAISRKSYVHPALIEAAKDAGAIGDRPLPRASKYLSPAERGLIEFLDALPEEQARVDEKGKVPAKAA